MSGSTRDPAKNRPRPENPAAEELPSSFGTWLRRQREVREISLREIADATKISYRYLEAFEQDRFDILPAHVFARGFLQEYAEYAGLDPAEVINNYLAALAAAAPEGEKPEPRSARSLGPNWWGSAALVAGTVAVIALVAWIAFAAVRHRERTRPAAPAPPPAEVALPPVGQASPPPAAVAAPSASVPAERSGESSAQTPPSAPAEGQVVSTSAAAPLKVTLDFSQNCWVDATIDGRRRVQQEHAEGETLELAAESSVRLTLGNAGGVEVRVNGQRLDLGKRAGEVARDVMIDLETIRKLAPGP